MEKILMHELAYLIAVYKLGSDYHSGQWSKGYRLLSLASIRLKRTQHNSSRMYDQLFHDQKYGVYPKHSKFRSLVAYYLFKLRKYRWEM